MENSLSELRSLTMENRMSESDNNDGLSHYSAMQGNIGAHLDGIEIIAESLVSANQAALEQDDKKAVTLHYIGKRLLEESRAIRSELEAFRHQISQEGYFVDDAKPVQRFRKRGE